MNPNNSWLASHMNTALSYALQVPNGELYKLTDFDKMRLRDGTFYRITEERRNRDLDRLIENLERYKEKWDTGIYDDSDPNSHIVSDQWEKVQYVIELIQSMPVPTQAMKIKESKLTEVTL